MNTKPDTATQFDQDLQTIANENKVMVMSFIAPDTVVRKSPISFDFASITVQDLYNIEKAIEQAKEAGPLPTRLHLVIHTPGGQVYAATKIARFLQSTFKNIEAYVPYEAASGGTMLCLAADEIIMDDVSNLTPIDPQIPYKGEYIAATSYAQAVDEFAQGDYKNKRLEELPPPYQAMIQKFDPVIRQQMEKLVFDTVLVAIKLMNRGMNPKNDPKLTDKLTGGAIYLAKTSYPHSHIFTREDAKEIGLNISENSDKLKLLRMYKKWVAQNLSVVTMNHIVNFYCPQEGGADAKAKTTNEPKAPTPNPAP